MPSPPQFRLDHASVVVPDLAVAVAEFDARLGLRPTVSAADPDRHSRVHLHRSYLEVAAGATDGGWELSHFFLRFEDRTAVAAHLRASGLACRFGTYTGVDGQWDDVEVDAASVPLPILVRRTHPPDVARDWPPPLRGSHRSGAWCLDAVVVTVPELSLAVHSYHRLTGVVPVVEGVDRDMPGVEFRLASGRVILIAGCAPGLTAIVLGVASLARTATVVKPLSGTKVAWLDPAVTHGIRVGFTEIQAG